MRRLFRGFLQRVRPAISRSPEPQPARSEAAPAVDQQAIDALAQPAVERLVEDEGVRGELTDDGFGPLIAWASNLLLDAARRAAATPEPEATMDQVAGQARELVRAISRGAVDGDLAPVRAALASPLLTPESARQAVSALPDEFAPDTTPDERARSLVSTLAEATGGEA